MITIITYRKEIKSKFIVAKQHNNKHTKTQEDRRLDGDKKKKKGEKKKLYATLCN